ncbi:MAG: DsbA family protein [Micrococcaceae bacterium]
MCKHRIIFDRISIDTWSNVVCPWCYIGKCNLEKALDTLSKDTPKVKLTYQSFELMPDMPELYKSTTANFLSDTKGMSEE